MTATTTLRPLYPDANPTERAALLSLEAVAGRGRLVAPLANPEGVIGGWVTELAERQTRGDKTSIIEHAALSYALRKGVFKDDPAQHKVAVDALKRAWRDLTSAVPKDIYARLPHSVLRGTRTIDQRLAAYSFETPVKSLTAAGYMKLLNEARKDYVFDWKDLKPLAVIAGASAASFGGTVAGYVFVTFNEYLYHLALGHPPKWLRETVEKPWMPKGVKSFFHKAWAAHDAHHFKTFRKSQYDMFDSGMSEDWIVRHLTRKYGAETAETIREQGFGLTFNTRNRWLFFAPTLVAATALYAVPATIALGLTWKLAAFAAGMTASVSLLQWGSAVQHVSDHQRADEALEHTESPLHRAYLQTKAARYMGTHHHVHHRYPNDNVNLNLNPGADVVLGSLRRADVRDTLEQYHEGGL